jgi:hypothetical protein
VGVTLSALSGIARIKPVCTAGDDAAKGEGSNREAGHKQRSCHSAPPGEAFTPTNGASMTQAAAGAASGTTSGTASRAQPGPRTSIGWTLTGSDEHGSSMAGTGADARLPLSAVDRAVIESS